MNSFDVANAHGKRGENLVKKTLEQAFKVKLATKKNLHWDLEIQHNRKEYRFEVKNDVKSKNTGNLAIEYWNTKLNKASGIGATTADFWVVVLELEDENWNPVEQAWITKTEDLRNYIHEKPPVRDVKGGDNNSAMKLYRKDDILSIFKRMDNLGKLEVFNLLEELTNGKGKGKN